MTKKRFPGKERNPHSCILECIRQGGGEEIKGITLIPTIYHSRVDFDAGCVDETLVLICVL